MLSKIVWFLCIAYFAAKASAANKCWFNDCQNSTTCESVALDCTEEVVKDSIQYLNAWFPSDQTSTENLPTKYECFVYGTDNCKLKL